MTIPIGPEARNIQCRNDSLLSIPGASEPVLVVGAEVASADVETSWARTCEPAGPRAIPHRKYNTAKAAIQWRRRDHGTAQISTAGASRPPTVPKWNPQAGRTRETRASV